MPTVCLAIISICDGDLTGKVANPARGQLTDHDFFIFLSPFASENLVSRDRFGRPVPRRQSARSHPG